ncbi:type II and III secretion system protein family protein [Novosphingobium sp. KCTC 2891]|uniref:type II and III secretion system protein family protein n=1 Tax=Novosphingobium sp. KCTC 2891 TaxID=2989730 RepID=UPI002221F652|nr:type II and III secretion system protein family protein [Novosphingobium sp. KCTC 2891]MCW1381222.1 type II and III secretion system protein family protein [Novosphingobium sp. KCTC 2891]
MKAPLLSTLLGATIAAGAIAVPAFDSAQAQSVTSPARSIALSIGRGELVTLPGSMADVFVANDEIADVQVKSANQLYVFGKAGGETTVYASNAAGAVIWSANVRVGTNLDSIDQMLHLAMPEARIATSTMNNTVLLTGTVAAPEDAAEAERLVKAFVGEKTTVISRLKMATPLQVSLHVKFAEVSRTLVRNLGMNWTSADASSGFKFGLGQGRAFYPQATAGGPLVIGTKGSDGTTVVTPNSSGTTLAGAGKLLGLDLLGALDAGETVGLVTTLSEPNLTALSGETADFLAGGEYPIPISQGLGATSIEYKKYGVSLAYTPTVLADGRISIRVRPEVSELSADGAVSLNGYSIPALTIRRAETTVELGSGQSFMIAGLMRNGNQNNVTKMPGAGDVPILGSLFRSTAFKKGETELVIVVTPYLVTPVDASAIKLPTDGFRAADALSQLLGNQENNGVTGGDRPKPSEKQGPAPSNPKVGALDRPTAPVADDRQSRKLAKDHASGGAAPGFNLK